jgi:two-component system sensor histidine kinase/response regulator
MAPHDPTRPEDLQAAVARAEAAEQALEQLQTSQAALLAGLSHALRTRMSSVLGISELLLDTPLRGEQREHVEILRACGDSTLTLLSDVLDYAELERGALTLSPAEFDPAGLCEDLVAVYGAQAWAKGLELVLILGEQMPPMVSGDERRLRQVLSKLIHNAVQYTRAGQVVLRTDRSQRDPRSLRFEVSDTGVGIQPERLPSLFALRAPAGGAGVGLGLPIAARLVEQLGGRLEVRSRPGAGSSFSFEIPLGLCNAGGVTQLGGALLSGARVLVVDDNDASREALCLALEPLGVRVGVARDGAGALQEALACAQTGRPYQLALIDEHLPGMSGAQLAGVLTQQRELAETLCVLMHRGGGRTRDPAVEAGLDKPVRRAARVSLLGRLLGGGPRRTEQPRPLRARVLLAEDNPVNQLLLRRQLERLGCQIEVVGDGALASAAAAAGGFDLVLMDCQMPVMDGWDACRAVRTSGGPGAATPIVALTASAMSGDRERCLEAGMDDYLTKPVSASALRKTIERWALRSRQAS